ncbi:MAG: hypothetical protein KF724_06020 [Phycisphaeraceae bacterium]|nr:hypothetical protein [Phycisphaeraceae bacterium]
MVRYQRAVFGSLLMALSLASGAGLSPMLFGHAAQGATPSQETPPSPPPPPNFDEAPAPVGAAPSTPAAPSAPSATPSDSSAPLPGQAPSPQSGQLPTIAILPVEASLPRYIFGTGPSGREAECGSEERQGVTLARRTTQDLLEAFVATQRFRVLERERIDRVMQEQNFQRTAGVDPRELTRLGRLLGADRVVATSLDLAGTACRKVEVRASGFVAFEFGGGIEVAYRVLDVATGEIVSMGRVTRTWDSRQSPELRSVLASPDGAIEFFSRQAAMAQTYAILDAIDPIKVAAVQDGVVILNQGRGRPMTPGTTLRVMIKGEPIRDPDTGAVLGEDGGEAALVQVFAVEERLSRARVVVGDATRIAVGARCRTIEVPGRPQ